jgi:hypothetical protein
MSMRVQRWRFLSLAALLLIGGAARAEEEQIYKWMDEKGQIHFTATPPPRNARPIGSKPETKPQVQIVPMPGSAAPKPASASSPTRRRAPRAVAPSGAAAPAPESADCGRHASTLERVRSAQRTIEALESSIERLENDDTASSRTSCNARGERLGVCRDGSYNRDRELERARERLQAAEDELADAEQEARAANVPPVCTAKD